MSLIIIENYRSGVKLKAAFWFLVFGFWFFSSGAYAQGDARVVTRIDSKQITVGDQARVFIDVQTNPATTEAAMGGDT